MKPSSAPPLAPPAAAARGWGWFRPVLLVALVFVAFGGRREAPFVFDDEESIVTNASIRDLGSWAWLRPPSTGGETVGGRPLLNLTFALNHAAGGLAPGGYRLANVAIHAAAALVLFGVVRTILRRCGGTPRAAADVAFLVAALWAVHPLQTESVLYVVQRAESLAGLWLLAVLGAYLRGADAAEAGRGRAARGWYAGAVGAAWLGAATKETVAVVPVLVLLVDRAVVSGSFAAAWRSRRWLYAGLASSWLLTAGLLALDPARGGSAGFGAGIAWWEYARTQAGAIVHYVRLAFWPQDLVFDHGTALVATWGEAALPLVLVSALLGAGAWLLWRNRPAGAALAAFFLLLAPSSSIVPVATQTMAEHRLYLPLAALMVLVVPAAARAARRAPRWVGPAAGVAAVGLLLMATVERGRVYASPLALWGDTAAKRPGNPRAQHNYGLALADAGRDGEAAEAFGRAIALRPNHAFAHASLASVQLRLGQPGEALGHADAALAADPKYGFARVQRAKALAQLGRRDEALAACRTALEVTPESAEIHYLLGTLWIAQRRLQPALEAFAAAVRFAPDWVEARANLGNCLLMAGRVREAIAAYEEVLRRRPGDAAVQGNLAVAREALAGAR